MMLPTFKGGVASLQLKLSGNISQAHLEVHFHGDSNLVKQADSDDQPPQEPAHTESNQIAPGKLDGREMLPPGAAATWTVVKGRRHLYFREIPARTKKALPDLKLGFSCSSTPKDH